MSRQWVIRLIGFLVIVACLLVLFSMQRTLKRLAENRGTVQQSSD